MQTFLPYSDFAVTAAVLDRRRLGKQRVEALQVLRAITVPGYGWRHHPAAKMWSGYQEALVCYGTTICARWRSEGGADTVAATLEREFGRPARSQAELAATGELPPWLGWEPLHRSHRSALLRKDAAHYGELFRDVPPDLPYEWPVTDR
ncbi:MSMEG_6728 family protein [Natronosporangium hydrolyticum]|uniref:MSMEG_6728 family protein n=1 Tax=Natronosporangium hydrolyticum TaxID=2811111 RepID=A0A895YBU3_9ACTN|nr:MSMEG_6728 family protein [Natronosporangium hydrolyticum]QSB13735.1 MSMEG_6728 family protein [Natronosporangium hydrolyticum]